jgi:hypothetical protein
MLDTVIAGPLCSRRPQAALVAARSTTAPKRLEARREGAGGDRARVALQIAHRI